MDRQNDPQNDMRAGPEQKVTVLHAIELAGEGGRRRVELTESLLDTGERLVQVEILDTRAGTRLYLFPYDVPELAAALFEMSAAAVRHARSRREVDPFIEALKGRVFDAIRGAMEG